VEKFSQPARHPCGGDPLTVNDHLLSKRATASGRWQTLGLRARPPTMFHHWRPGFGFTPPRSEIIREDSFFSEIPPFPPGPCDVLRIPPIMRLPARPLCPSHCVSTNAFPCTAPLRTMRALSGPRHRVEFHVYWKQEGGHDPVRERSRLAWRADVQGRRNTSG